MEYISTTDLRTKSSQIIKTLKKGYSIKLIYRSQVVGNITPQKSFSNEKPAIQLHDIYDDLVKIIPSATKRADWKKLYHKELQHKYGKNFS